MFQRATFRSARPAKLRTRAALLAAGLGVSVALGAGAGAASAAGTTAAPAAVSAKSAATWVTPVKNYKLTAGFNQNGARWANKHSGQDFAVPVGTPVLAASAGTVVKAGPNGAGDGPAYGNAVVLKHANGKYSQYAHLSRIDVKIGQKVAAGQRIALSGNTGNSTGPHLHFEIRTTPNYGSAVNPLAYLRP
ncbi:peptidase [Streptomyces sp. F-3]|uniref:M23ase beta-sheet core domain-containing protein n=1 Tax=Streptomyces thermogriseus TaxID=75292 RepID=A0ABN1T4T9_9ACTN|nr:MULTISPECIES: M23 family metallopeptidase [Streptomyces]MDN5381206.1 M23 family metallopeptidase [Streptomyces sp. LB8]GAT81694.1 peptidase [Streptomyces sp. F-3]